MRHVGVRPQDGAANESSADWSKDDDNRQIHNPFTAKNAWHSDAA